MKRFRTGDPGLTATLALAAALAATAGALEAQRDNRTAAHAAHAGAAGAEPLEIARVLRAPEHFVGNLAYDAGARRLWLTSWGPPANTRGPSFLYEVEASTGEVLERARLPFLGEFGGAAYVDGYLHQVIPYESRLYRVDVSKDRFGAVASSVKLPTLNELDLDGDVYRFPFIAFTGAAASPRGELLLYAADLGELMTIDPASGALRRRVKTTKGLAGITGVPFGDGRFLLLGTFDPVDSAFRQEQRRFMFRAGHGILPLETVRAEGNYGNPGQKTITWTLLDPETGEVLAAASTESTRLAAGSAALLVREGVPGTRYGRLTALTTGEEGLLTVNWTPR